MCIMLLVSLPKSSMIALSLPRSRRGVRAWSSRILLGAMATNCSTCPTIVFFFFLCRRSGESANVFQNANAAYLNAGNTAESHIPSPLNIGVENFRRFRALPVYASLLSYGRTGYQTMLQKQIRLARMITGWLFDHPEYMVLPQTNNKAETLDHTYIVVLFTSLTLTSQSHYRINHRYTNIHPKYSQP